MLNFKHQSITFKYIRIKYRIGLKLINKKVKIQAEQDIKHLWTLLDEYELV